MFDGFDASLLSSQLGCLGRLLLLLFDLGESLLLALLSELFGFLHSLKLFLLLAHALFHVLGLAVLLLLLDLLEAHLFSLEGQLGFLALRRRLLGLLSFLLQLDHGLRLGLFHGLLGLELLFVFDACSRLCLNSGLLE